MLVDLIQKPLRIKNNDQNEKLWKNCPNTHTNISVFYTRIPFRATFDFKLTSRIDLCPTYGMAFDMHTYHVENSQKLHGILYGFTKGKRDNILLDDMNLLRNFTEN